MAASVCLDSPFRFSKLLQVPTTQLSPKGSKCPPSSSRLSTVIIPSLLLLQFYHPFVPPILDPHSIVYSRHFCVTNQPTIHPTSMSFRSNCCLNLHLHSSPSCFLNRNLVSFLGVPSYQISEFRVWRRRRLKFDRKLSVVVSNNQLLGPLLVSPQFENLFKNLISQFPSVNSLDLIAPALGLASGVVLYLATPNTNSDPKDLSHTTSGEWILFTSPTPFNRFVMLRCPSISFQGSELLEDVNEKLVKEDRHYVKLNNERRRIQEARDSTCEQKLVYQRVCVSNKDDGGVISLDWPANLNMTEDRGLDTTLLLVPGTTEGSMDKDVRSFVCDSLKRGCFPIVMNPRGCADSPLTTARLFTAADSNDVSTAIQFIIKERPWTTLMGIGWGYGANMLTKYLAEVGERTPLTAAACVDNPFDLEEVARSAIHHVDVDQKLTSGLIHILKSNKELFQGKAKEFDVEKALSATSVRDFEKAISMISHGFETVEEFYAASSTRELVGNVKIPLLFIQTDNETVPPFSIPRSSISENPFTSLLLCSYLPSRIIIRGRSALSWCQGIVIEWLTAVELALLKGRHPLLKDVDVTINPSKGLSLVEGRESDKRKKANKILDFGQTSALNRYVVDPVKDTLEESDRADSVHLRSRKSLESRKEENNDVSEESNTVEAGLVKEEGDDTAGNEESQVLLSAQTIMNMLDVTMPGTLSEKQKQKVLTAMGQGETLMMALEGAVPEDVRGKLTTAVSEIVKTQGTNVNLGSIMRAGRIPNESSVVKVQETLGEPSPAADGYNDAHSLDQMKRADEQSDGTDKNQTDIENPADVKNQSLDPGHSQSYCIPVADNPSSEGNMESDKNHGNGELSDDTAAQSLEYAEAGSETGGSSSEKAVEPQDVVDEQVSVNQDTAETEISRKSSSDIQTREENNMEDSTVQSNPIPTTETEEAIVTPSPEPQSMEKEGNGVEKSDDKNVQPMDNQNNVSPPQSEESTPSNPPASSPSISVSQAFSALGGFDDSTQIAVTSVFGVLENIITQFEEGIEKRNDGEQGKLHDEEYGSASEESPITVETENKLGKKYHQKEDTKSELILESQASDTKYRSDENRLTPNCTSALKNSSSRGNNIGNVDKDGRKSKDLIDPRILTLNSDKVGLLQKIPLCVTVNPYGDSLYNEYLRKYLLAKMSSPKSLDLDSTTDLLLDYFPEEGQWKFLDQPGNSSDSVTNIRTHKDVSGKDRVILSPLQAKDTDRFVETSYVIFDTENEQQPLKNYKIVDGLIKKFEEGSPRTEELICLLKYIVLDSLKVEVGRRLGLPDVREIESNLADDLEEVADAVSLGVGHNQDLIWSIEKKDPSSGKVGTLHGEHIINIISSAVQDTRFLRKVLPVGVVVGSTLASLRKYFTVATEHDEFPKIETILDQANNAEEKFCDEDNIRSDHQLAHKKDPQSDRDSLNNGGSEKTESGFLNRNTAMVGAVTAALGASTFLAHEQTEPFRNNEAPEVSSMSLGETVNHDREHDKLEDVMSENNHNAVSSLAEKAMSVAGPVVPTKGDGAVDQERLVAMLAELGQKGGILQLVGKVALLWSGLRGAMSLTEKLISFLRLAERPLFQRILGFVGMVLVMWSPVVIPLFPSLVQSWSARKSTGFALYACIFGLYLAVVILIMLWGKRIRGYEKPLKQYGLDLASLPKIYELTKGLIGGVMLVLSIHSINALLGYTSLIWPSHLKSSPDSTLWVKVYGGMLTMAGQGIVTAIVVSIVEELVFRSWLPEEIAVDFGYNRAVIISGLAFAILQRSLWAMPGFWLLSIALSGARQRNKGSLSIPIGMRAGILASCYILQTGGFLVYHLRNPSWLTGTQPLQPFSGAVGLAASLTVAALLHQRRTEPLGTKKITSAITE